jgi:hypothetical protein
MRLTVVSSTEERIVVEEIDVEDGSTSEVSVVPTRGRTWGHVMDRRARMLAFQQYQNEFTIETRLFDIRDNLSRDLDDSHVDGNVTPLWTPDGKGIVYVGYAEDTAYVKFYSMAEGLARELTDVNDGDTIGEVPVERPFWLVEGTYLGVVSYEEQGSAVIVAELPSRKTYRWQSSLRLSRLTVVGGEGTKKRAQP